MKNVLTWMLALALMLPLGAGEREDALLKGLFGLGARALETQVEKTAPAAEATAAPSAAASPAARPAQQTLPFGQALTASLKPALDGLIDEYKEQYKEEGRAYARELGDMVVERVVQDPDINSTITSLRILCWFVVGYLTLVTLIMLGCLVCLKRANAQLLARVEELARRARR